MVHGDPFAVWFHHLMHWFILCSFILPVMERMPGFNVDNHRSSESARAMCMHARFFTLYKWVRMDTTSVHFYQETLRFGGRMRKPISLNGEIKLCFFFGWKDEIIHFLEWIVMSWLAKIVSPFFAALLVWRCQLFAGGQHVISNKLAVTGSFFYFPKTQCKLLTEVVICFF